MIDSEVLSDRYAAVIFDCDGTLSDSMPAHYVAWRETLATVGIEFSRETFYSLGGMSSERIVTKMAEEQNVAGIDPATISLRKEQAFATRLSELEPIEWVCQLARSLAGRMPTAVASGGIRPIIDRQLEQIGLSELFDVIVTAEDTERHKPDPDVFLEAAQRMGVDPTRCLVLEDSPLGLAAADAAGMDAVDVRPGQSAAVWHFANRQHGPWRIKSSYRIYVDPWLTVRRDEVMRPDGQPGSYCVVDLKPGVCVIAMDERGNVYLTEEFHFGVGRVTLEGVSGGIDGDESPLACAQRELREEIGVCASTITPLGTVDPFTASVVSPTTLYLATGLTFVEAAQEGTEQIRRVRMSLAEAVQGVEDGRITHAPSCVAILKTDRLHGTR